MKIKHITVNGNVAGYLLASDVPQDQYWDNVTSLLNFDGTNGSATFIDAKNNTVTYTGSPTLSSAQKQTGTTAAYFPANSQMIINGSPMLFGTGDFTLEFWAMNTTAGTNYQTLVYNGISGSSGILQVRYGDSGFATQLQFLYGPNSTTNDPLKATAYNQANVLNKWHHFALTRQNGTVRGFVDGVLIGTVTNSTNFSTGPTMVIGAAWAGYIDSLRTTRGVARYTANFTPSTVPFPTTGPSTIPTGISIGGWNGTTSTMSSGVTKVGNLYKFSGASQIDYIRIPYTGTIDPSNTATNVEIDITFQINAAITNINSMLLSRYEQGQDPASWAIGISTSNVLTFFYNNANIAIGAIKIGVQNTIKVTRIGGVWQFYLNGVLVQTLNYTHNGSANWDWVIGSYLNFTGGVINATYAGQANWYLYGLTVKNI